MTGITIKGHGLSANDILRIIPYGVDCRSADNDPTPTNSLKVGCASVEGIGCITGKEGTDSCPQIDGETCRTAGADDKVLNALGGIGSYLRLQTLGRDQIIPPVGISDVMENHALTLKEGTTAEPGMTVIKFSTRIQDTDLRDGDTIVIDKRDLVFYEKMGSKSYTFSGTTNWKSNPVLREAANVFWDGNRLAYPHRTGFRRRFQVGVRRQCQVSVIVGSAQSMSQCLHRPMHSPCYRVACQICGVMADVRGVAPCRICTVPFHGYAQVLTE